MQYQVCPYTLFHEKKSYGKQTFIGVILTKTKKDIKLDLLRYKMLNRQKSINTGYREMFLETSFKLKMLVL